MNVQSFALIYGIVFLIVGIAGFLPGATVAHSHPDVNLTTGLGLLLGLFPVNVLHNLVHLAFGGWGLLGSMSLRAALVYARATAVIYALLAVLGLVPTANLHTTFGWIPLYGHDVWLHALLAAAAAYFGFVHRMADEPDPLPNR